MRHRILTCKNHSNLRWSCKEIAWTDGQGYNGARGLFFKGVPTGKGMYADGSGLDTTEIVEDEFGGLDLIKECDCKASELILAPEDALVKKD